MQRRCEQQEDTIRFAKEDLREFNEKVEMLKSSVFRFKGELEEVIGLYEERMNTLSKK